MKLKAADEKKYRLYAVSGNVIDFGKAVTTFSYNAANAPELAGIIKMINISSPVHLHTHIFITDENKTEHLLNLDGLNATCSKGHILYAQ